MSKRFGQRILSFFLAFVMLFSLSITSFAVDGSADISVLDKTQGRATIIEPDVWYEGYNTFDVIASVPCVAFVVHANGTDERLYCAEVDVETGHHRFQIETVEGDIVCVAFKGDADLNGRVNIMDLTRLNQYLGNRMPCDVVARYATDVDSNSRQNIMDMTRVNQYLAALYSWTWDVGWSLYLDTDGDGVPDFEDDDIDGDGIFNTEDLDDDNDGIPDVNDWDSDEFIDFDTDGDGIFDFEDDDIDNDGIKNDVDEDDNGDGILDKDDFSHADYDPDSDEDGLRDSEDPDDDNDGIPDVNDFDNPGFVDFDTDKDGISDFEDPDVDDDGILNADDPDDDGDGVYDYLDTTTDSDGDGVNDFDDEDDDGDGVPDIEDSDHPTYDADGDGVLNIEDSDDDNDGIADEDDPDYPFYSKDTDGDGVLDFEDDDIDGDGILNTEDSDSDGDGVDNYLDTNTDSDGDDINDFVDEDDDNDGIPDVKDPDHPLYDADGDGIRDADDEDDNNDGISDTEDPSHPEYIDPNLTAVVTITADMDEVHISDPYVFDIFHSVSGGAFVEVYDVVDGVSSVIFSSELDELTDGNVIVNFEDVGTHTVYCVVDTDSGAEITSNEISVVVFNNAPQILSLRTNSDYEDTTGGYGEDVLVWTDIDVEATDEDGDKYTLDYVKGEKFIAPQSAYYGSDVYYLGVYATDEYGAQSDVTYRAFAIDAETFADDAIYAVYTNVDEIPAATEFEVYFDASDIESLTGVHWVVYDADGNEVDMDLSGLDMTGGTMSIYTGLGVYEIKAFGIDEYANEFDAGSAYITVTEKKDYYTIGATNGTIVGGTTQMNVGDSMNLDASPVYNASEESWHSSDANVATVDSSGKVTAIAPGTVTITYKNDGRGLSGSITVTIYAPLKSISLNKTSVSLNKGSSDVLSVTYNPSNTTDDKTVTWTSSNNSVATVSSVGKITAVAPGSATITAKVGSKTATCTVTVLSPLSSISMNKSSLSVDVGKTATLSVSYNPSDTTDSRAVTWTSSNTSVATVSSSGVVTGKAKGSATITAKVGSKTTTCSVTVTDPTIYLTSISLNKTSMSLTVGNTGSLSVTYNPSNTTESKTVTWTSSNTSVATVSSSGVVTAKGAGSATITAKVGSKTATCKVTVTAATSIFYFRDTSSSKKITCYFENGMTWSRWCSSSYNNRGWYVYGGKVFDRNARYTSGDSPTGHAYIGTSRSYMAHVSASSKIIAEKEYSHNFTG